MRPTPSVVSVQVGRPREILWSGRQFRTAIVKAAVHGPVRVEKHNLAGDEQADLSVHGGPDKAVYAYPSEHYAFWEEHLQVSNLMWGSFGENLTTAGFDERDLAVGDRLRIGSVLLEVRQPRTPCYKLNYRFDRADMVKRFWDAERSGFYLGIIEEGSLRGGDPIVLHPVVGPRVTIAQLVRLLRDETVDLALVRRALETEALPEPWKISLRERFSEAMVH